MTDAEKQPVSFACQRCLQPIVLDEHLEKISVHAMAELSRKTTILSLNKLTSKFSLYI